jgi:hypothetical protein
MQVFHPEKMGLGGRSELDWGAVHAVALIRGRLEAFSLEHMAQMPAAGCASDLHPPTIRIGLKTMKHKWSVYKSIGMEKGRVGRSANGDGDILFGLWLLEVPQRKQASRSPSRTWCQTCTAGFRSQRSYKPRQLWICCILLFRVTWTWMRA